MQTGLQVGRAKSDRLRTTLPHGMTLHRQVSQHALPSTDEVATKPHNARRLLGGWVVLVLGMVAVLVGIAVPAPAIGWLRTDIPGFAMVSDWLVGPVTWINPLHVLVFAALACWWRLLMPGRSRWLIFLGLGGLGMVTELLQHFVPGRDARVSDVVNDLAGVLAGFAIAWILARWMRRST